MTLGPDRARRRKPAGDQDDVRPVQQHPQTTAPAGDNALADDQQHPQPADPAGNSVPVDDQQHPQAAVRADDGAAVGDQRHAQRQQAPGHRAREQWLARDGRLRGRPCPAAGGCHPAATGCPVRTAPAPAAGGLRPLARALLAAATDLHAARAAAPGAAADVGGPASSAAADVVGGLRMPRPVDGSLAVSLPVSLPVPAASHRRPGARA